MAGCLAAWLCCPDIWSDACCRSETFPLCEASVCRELFLNDSTARVSLAVSSGAQKNVRGEAGCLVELSRVRHVAVLEQGINIHGEAACLMVLSRVTHVAVLKWGPKKTCVVKPVAWLFCPA